ncbi:MAG: serine/threonine protein kinase [Elusimicrobia bacterium]|nr:serine/threonine protein kinase [Elusimicrobiota bacterium]MDE2426168.1 serine/threonine protein kinase [Elusimicrobiota bacterium]
MPLFEGGQPPGVASGRAPRRGGLVLLLLLTLSGGILFAAALLHTASGWRGAKPPGRGSFWEGYELIGELGSGGMGLVYEARDRALQRRVAIKKMREEFRSDPLERRRFLREARLVAALHHPNIVDIYEIAEDGGDILLVFEFVPGETLADRLRRGPLSFASAKRLFSGVCAALAHAHARRIVHRDLKPSNIMLAEDGAVKVMDFGVARQAKEALSKASLASTIVGTPPYMAPEQEQGLVRPESDLYALGVILYECLSGELPFSGVGAGMLRNKLESRYVPLSRRASRALPSGLDAMLARALQPDPGRRFHSAADWLAALDALGRASGS